MFKVKFKYPDQVCVYPKLIAAVNVLCVAKGKDANCVSGYRSLENQIATNKSVLQSTPGATQHADGSVYNKSGQCLAAAYGKSNHCFCIAMDIDDAWFKSLTNAELAKYGLVKPMGYEPWHIQLLEHNGITQAQKESIRDSCLKGVGENMNVVNFQKAFGLETNGIGPITRAKAKEVLTVCHEILGIHEFKTADEVIKATQSSPDIWLTLLKVVKYFDSFVMNIYKKMKGE